MEQQDISNFTRFFIFLKFLFELFIFIQLHITFPHKKTEIFFKIKDLECAKPFQLAKPNISISKGVKCFKRKVLFINIFYTYFMQLN